MSRRPQRSHPSRQDGVSQLDISGSHPSGDGMTRILPSRLRFGDLECQLCGCPVLIVHTALPLIETGRPAVDRQLHLTLRWLRVIEQRPERCAPSGLLHRLSVPKTTARRMILLSGSNQIRSRAPLQCMERDRNWASDPPGRNALLAETTRQALYAGRKISYNSDASTLVSPNSHVDFSRTDESAATRARSTGAETCCVRIFDGPKWCRMGARTVREVLPFCSVCSR
ncbi:unnamed protein product, partial [Mycena citricolor]